MNIPIQNLYYLLLYAWDALEAADQVDVTLAAPTTLMDLLASILTRSVHHIARRGLDRGYIPRHERVAGIRGKLDFAATIKAMGFRSAAAVCEFDDLSHDVLHNRIIKSTLGILQRCPDLDEEVAGQLARAAQRLGGIRPVVLSARVFRSVQLHRNNRFYRFPLEICRLVHQAMIVDETSGTVRFADFTRDDRRMRVLFERFVRNFYRREQSVFEVRRERIPWSGNAVKTEANALLPNMNTDVTLVRPGHKIIVETKFVPTPFQERFGKRMFRSSHLYQLAAYLGNDAPRLLPGVTLEGVLVYPCAIDGPVRCYQIYGHPVRVVGLRLDHSWNEVRRKLLSIVDPDSRDGVAEAS